MLGADVVVAERERLAQRELENLLRARRERDLAGRYLVALADDARDLRAHLFDGDVEGLEHARGEAFFLAQQAEQDVLGADVVVLQRPRLVLRENDDLPCPFSEALEQTRPFWLGKGHRSPGAGACARRLYGLLTPTSWGVPAEPSQGRLAGQIPTRPWGKGPGSASVCWPARPSRSNPFRHRGQASGGRTNRDFTTHGDFQSWLVSRASSYELCPRLIPPRP